MPTWRKHVSDNRLAHSTYYNRPRRLPWGRRPPLALLGGDYVERLGHVRLRDRALERAIDDERQLRFGSDRCTCGCLEALS
jgi:hypothetical protein